MQTIPLYSKCKCKAIVKTDGTQVFIISREKGRKLTQSYDKCPYTHRKIQKQRKNATKNFDDRAIADRLRMVSWTNDSHLIGGVNRFAGFQPSH